LNKIIIELPSYINLVIYITFGTGLSLLCIFTDNFPKFDKIKIKCPKLEGNITIVHLTDLHLGGAYGRESVELYVNMILNLKEKIDFVVITGDLVDGNIRVTKEMLEPFSLIRVPIYYVTGNHEDLTWKDEFLTFVEKSSNLIRLPNNLIAIDNRINLIGIDYKKDKEIIKKQLKGIIDGVKNNLPIIFVYHAPIFRPNNLEEYNIFLMLCGHKHGGWCFPFTFIQFVFGKWIKYIIEGLYSCKNKNFIYCCSGLGTSGPNSRCFVRANIGLITLEGN
jgi:predicted MPP superfamily phosphohydrolase